MEIAFRSLFLVWFNLLASCLGLCLNSIIDCTMRKSKFPKFSHSHWFLDRVDKRGNVPSTARPEGACLCDHFESDVKKKCFPPNDSAAPFFQRNLLYV